MNRIDRIKGTLFGVACGDALGATLEFSQLQENHVQLTEIVGGGVFNLKPGTVTDDTDMTIAVAEGLLSNPLDPIEEIGNNWVKWYNSEPFDIGNSVRLAIENYLIEHNWRVASAIAHYQMNGKSAGNGSLMRTAPISFYKNMEDVVKWSKKISKMTHYDKLAEEACVIYNKILYRLMNGEDKNRVILDEIKNTPYVNVLKMDENSLRPTGYVVDTLECVLWSCLVKDSFEDIVVTTANLCGDADTIAAIAGGLAGCYYGVNNIPDRWLNKILIKNKINNICESFMKDVNFN